MNKTVELHLTNLAKRVARGEVTYERLAGAIDAFIVVDAITLQDAKNLLTEAKHTTI